MAFFVLVIALASELRSKLIIEYMPFSIHFQLFWPPPRRPPSAISYSLCAALASLRIRLTYRIASSLPICCATLDG